MRRAAHPSGGMDSSNPCRWRGKRLHHHGGDVCCVFVLCVVVSLVVCKKVPEHNLKVCILPYYKVSRCYFLAHPRVHHVINPRESGHSAAGHIIPPESGHTTPWEMGSGFMPRVGINPSSSPREWFFCIKEPQQVSILGFAHWMPQPLVSSPTLPQAALGTVLFFQQAFEQGIQIRWMCSIWWTGRWPREWPLEQHGS